MALPDSFDISEWLTKIGLAQYIPNFTQNDITPHVLPDLTDADLAGIGITSIGHRKVLAAKIRELTGAGQVAAPEPAAPIAPAAPAPFVPPEPEVSAPAFSPPAAPFIPPPSYQEAAPEAAPVEEEVAVETVSYHVAPRPPKLTGWKRLYTGRFLFISIIVHILFGATAAIVVVQSIQAKRKLTFKPVPMSVNANQHALEHKVQMAKKQAGGGAPALAKRIATSGASKVSLPAMPELPSTDTVVPIAMSGMGGVGTGLGTGVGSGMGSGSGGTGTGSGSGFGPPAMYKQRCSPIERLQKLKALGGDPENEAAVVKALHYFVDHQNADGSWGSQHQVAMTGLALLVFLGHCEQPGSPTFGQSVEKALDYFAKKGVDANGYLVPMNSNPAPVYEQAIGVYALGEAFALTKDERLAPILRAGVKAICDGQGPDGGWVYNYAKTTPSDTSVSAWQVQALRAAKHSGGGAAGASTAISKAVANFERVQNENGMFGYRDPTGNNEPRYSLTGASVVALQIAKRAKTANARKAIKVILEKATVDWGAQQEQGGNIYSWYYNTLACFNEGGEEWKKWNAIFQGPIRKAQSADGSWPRVGGSMAGPNGDDADAVVYRTALCALMLEVYYRYLPSDKEDSAK